MSDAALQVAQETIQMLTKRIATLEAEIRNSIRIGEPRIDDVLVIEDPSTPPQEQSNE